MRALTRTAAFAALSAASLTLAAAEPPRPWKTLAASGAVQARPAGAEPAAWRAVARGDEFAPRTVIETGRKARATLARQASLVIVDPGSRVELPEAPGDVTSTSVVQTHGSVLYEVDGHSTPHFEVVTPYLVAGVKGTAFLVTVDERRASVTVKHGRVEITRPDGGESLMLGPGESVIRERDAHEMELVREGRGSRTARREERRLERMERERVDTEATPLAQDGLKPGTDDARLALNDVGAAWPTKESGKEPLGTETVDSPLKVVEDLREDLLKESIREEIRDGVIVDPVDKVHADPPVPTPNQN